MFLKTKQYYFKLSGLFAVRPTWAYPQTASSPQPDQGRNQLSRPKEVDSAEKRKNSVTTMVESAETENTMLYKLIIYN